MTKVYIQQLLKNHFERFTVIERGQGIVDFYLPGSLPGDFLFSLISHNRPAGAVFNIHTLPWWKNRFKKTQWKFR